MGCLLPTCAAESSQWWTGRRDLLASRASSSRGCLPLALLQPSYLHTYPCTDGHPITTIAAELLSSQALVPTQVLTYAHVYLPACLAS